MSRKTYAAKEILVWRRKNLNIGGRVDDLDWLLDIGGGLGWEKLQKLKIFQNSSYFLEISLEELSYIWARHINDQIPLQYLLGKCPWRDFELEVNSSAMIPRQETEIIIELAMDKIKSSHFGRWADLGTGSGVLGIGLSKSFPHWHGHMVDISKEALELAAKNTNRLVPSAKIQLHLGNWWDPLQTFWGSFDLVVANPPYIPSNVLKALEPVVRNHEPHLALCGGDDGMDSCKEIMNGALKGLSKGGWLIFEHHHDQSERTLDYLIRLGLKDVSYENDLSGVKRFALARRP